ncbi:MAG TPA: TolC family protein [Bacteroidaceae bacterium]|nr:TolC family protein [Bacteroidaceae bacterium]
MKRILLAILIVMPFAGLGQTIMTLEECIRLAEANNRKIEASEQLFLASGYDRRSAKALFFPSFSLSGNILYSTSEGSYSTGSGLLPVVGADGIPTGQSAFFPGLDLSYGLDWIYSGGIKVEQPLYMGGKIRAGYQITKIGNEIAGLNKRLTEADVIVETSRAYAEVVRTKELMQVALSYHNLLNELMRTVESAWKHGMKSQNEVLKVEVKLNESELNLRRAENGHRLATMNLCHYIGVPLIEQIDVDCTLPEVNIAHKQETGIYNRPEYLILEQKVGLARQQVNMARSEYLPQIGLVGQYGYTNGIELNGRKLFDDWNFLVGVQVSIPLFDFGYRANKIKSAKSKYAQMQAEREDINGKLMLEMTQAFNNLDEASLEKTLAESSVISAEENLRTSRLHYEKGMETLSDYMEAQTLWQQAHQTQVNARINSYLRWLEYQRTIGGIR